MGRYKSNQITFIVTSSQHMCLSESVLQTVQKLFTYRKYHYILTDVYRWQCAIYKCTVYTQYTQCTIRHTYSYQYTLYTVCTHSTLCTHIYTRGVRKYRYTWVSQYFVWRYCIDSQKRNIDIFKKNHTGFMAVVSFWVHIPTAREQSSSLNLNSDRTY